MIDVLFVTPNVTENIFDESVGTMLLATILRQNGVKVEILPFIHIGDVEHFSDFKASAVEIIKEKQPKIVSFYTRCDCYHVVLTLAELIKEQLGCYVVLGGPQADITAKDTIEEIPYVDYICCGEGETTIYPFFSSLLRGEPDHSIPGLVFRSVDGVVANTRPKLLEDFDSLPMLDFVSLLPDSHYNPTNPFPLDVGRGCPFGCTYCSTKTFWGRKYRLKSPQRIVEEIKYYHDTLGVSYFNFAHDMLTMNRKQVLEMCELIKALDFKVKWNCSARIDCIDKELIDIMVESGLNRIYMGIETGSPRMQKLINKNLKLDSVLDMLSYLHSKKITITASFIYGLPEETEEDLSQTIALISEIKKFKKIIVQVHLCTFLPGTEISEVYKDTLTPVTEFPDIIGNMAINDCKELIFAHKKIFSHFNEYKTELRTKMQFLPFFFDVFGALRPVYGYFAEKYDADHKIDMYYDFVKANENILTSHEYTNNDEKYNAILHNDGFTKLFENDPLYDTVMDVYKLKIAVRSLRDLKTGTVTEISSVSPIDLDKSMRLQDCPKRVNIVTYTKLENGKIETKVSHA